MRPIKAAAAAVEPIERSRLFLGPSEIELSEPFRRRHGTFNGAVGVTTEVLSYGLENVVLDADTMILLQDGLTIPETVYGLSADQSNRPPVIAERLIKLDDAGPYIIGFTRVHAGIFSWLTQSLPAIDWSVRGTPESSVRLVLPAPRGWQEALLAALGYHDLPRLIPEAGRQYLIPRARYATFLNGSTDFGVCLSKVKTARRILSALRPSGSTPRRVYVPSDRPYYGRITNADAVAELLRSRGFHILKEGDQSPLDRINTLRNADVVVGPHSDTLSFILFGKPGALLWEFMSPDSQNASINRLAQAVGIDYWGDILGAPHGPQGGLTFDIPDLRRRLDELDRRLANLPARQRRLGDGQSQFWRPPMAGAPIDELMLGFESLGDNCQFGLVQRWSGVEPLGLLRFSSIAIPEEGRVAALVQALRERFDGLGAPETIGIDLNGDPPSQEYMVLERAYNLSYHTGASPQDHTRDQLLQREVKRLPFLARKMLDDLSTGAKIWIWSCPASTRREHVRPLLDCLREMGPNRLLWVVPPDHQHAAGTIERLDRDLIRGYAHRFMLDSATAENLRSWHEVCQRAYDIWGNGGPGEPSHDADGRYVDAISEQIELVSKLTKTLQANFPSDRIEHPEGATPGSDFVYLVMGLSGQVRERIYCSIDTDNDGAWYEERLAAVRQRASDVGAEIPVFISSVVQSGRLEFDRVSGVWVTTPQLLVAAFTQLRLSALWPLAIPAAPGNGPGRFYGLGACQRELSLAHCQGPEIPSSSVAADGRIASEPWSARETIRHLMTGFIGLADTPSLVCPFHQWIGECRRETGAPAPLRPIQEAGTDIPWWKRDQAAAASGMIHSCALHDALKQASRIFVWRGVGADQESEVRGLLAEMRRRGPNILLWVAFADEDHPADLVEYVGSGLLRGYLARAAAGGPLDADAGSWRTVCQNAARLVDYLYSVGELSAPYGATGVEPQPQTDPDEDDIDVREAAVETFLEEAASTEIAAGPVVVGGEFAETDRALFAENPGSQDVHGSLLENVVMLPSYPVLFQKGRKIAELVRSNTLPFERANLAAHLEGLRIIASGKIAVLGFNRGVAAYYHWIMQSLPAIDLPLQRFGPEQCALVVPRLTSWQEESLALLGLGQVARVETPHGQEFFLPRVYFSNFLTGRTAFFLSPRTMTVLDRMAEGIEPGTDLPKRLYVSRADSANRRLMNEPEVERLLSDRGFTVVVPGTLSLREQIRLFRGAEVIIGPHGGGMTNLAFCRPGAKVLELAQSNYANPCMNRIAQVRRLEYHAECFEAASEGDIHAQPWRVDTSRLLRKVRDFLS